MNQWLALAQVVEACYNHKARQAIKFLAPQFIVKATRRFKPDKRSYHEEIIITIGKPNYRERKFIRQCLRAKEPFPIKKIKLKWYKPNE